MLLSLPTERPPVSILLTHARILPGIIHALYLTHIYYERQNMLVRGDLDPQNPMPAFGVMSPNILRGSRKARTPASGLGAINLEPIGVSYACEILILNPQSDEQQKTQSTEPPNPPDNQSKNVATVVAEDAIRSGNQSTANHPIAEPANDQRPATAIPTRRSSETARSTRSLPIYYAASA